MASLLPESPGQTHTKVDVSTDSPPCIWKLARRELRLDGIPCLMGIVNVTPDSFSDGGAFLDVGRAVEHALKLAACGAGILDIGGESTRPYSTPVDAAEECRRILPVIRALAEQTSVPISVDTSKAVVAQAALEAGAEIINDVTGLTGDAEMLPLAVRTGAGVCVMHMQGTPQSMQDAPTYGNVTQEIAAFLAARKAALMAEGVAAERIVLDPGIGFGKTHAHNLQLLREVATFHKLGSPLLIGHSRKGMIGKVLGDAQADRLFGTLGVGLAMAAAGVQLLRVHDVGPMQEALQLFAAAGGIPGLRWPPGMP